ncbi:MAG: hypothetical protein ABW118_10360 [Candidatus Thiodiazotropha sp.]
MSLYDQIAKGFDPLQGLEDSARINFQGQQLIRGLQQKEQAATRKNLWDHLKFAETQRLNDSTIRKNTEAAAKQVFDMQSSILKNVKTPEQFAAAKIRLAHVGAPLPENVTFENLGSYVIPDTPEFGYSVHYGKRGKDTIGYQVASDGTVKEVKLPGGATPTKPLSFQNLGGQIVGKNVFTGESVTTDNKTVPPQEELAFVKKSSQAKAEGKSRGEDIQNTRNNLGKFTQQANYSIRLLEGLKNHPGLPYATGVYSVMPKIPGTAQADFIARAEQLEGATFLQAFQQLKGGGHITEIEGEKAQNAVARMQRSQSKEEFVKAADEYIGILSEGLRRMRDKARGVSPDQEQIPVYNPATGEFE